MVVVTYLVGISKSLTKVLEIILVFESIIYSSFLASATNFKSQFGIKQSNCYIVKSNLSVLINRVVK